MIKISIIMPVFNGEKYLKEAMEAIENQTMKEFELICINDGSTDGTANILREYEQKDERIHVVENTERKGAAFSRNRGIYLSKGEYLVFLDADDLYAEELLEIAYGTAKQKDADIVMYQLIYFTEDNVPEPIVRHISEPIKNRYCKECISITDFSAVNWMFWENNLCDKIFRKSFIEKEKIFFQELPSANDAYFVDMSFMLTKRLVHAQYEKILYYARNHQTPTRISYYRDPMCVCTVYEKIYEELKMRGMWEEMQEYYMVRFFLGISYAMKNCKNTKRDQEVYEYLRLDVAHKIGIKGISESGNIPQSVKNVCLALNHNRNYLDWCFAANYLKILLECNVSKIRKLLKNDLKKTAIWGAGENGKVMLEFCDRYSLSIEWVIDKSQNKWGQVIGNKTIQSLQDTESELERVLVVTSSYYDEIYEEIRSVREDIEVIDLKMYLLY